MIPSYVEVALPEIVRICSSLADISANSIGSSNQKTLLTSSSGSVFFLNDGIDILNSLQFSHPIARFVVTSLQQMHNFCADGSKRFILYLTEILHSIQKHLEIQGCLSQGRSTEKEFLRKLSHTLKDFEKEFFPEKIFGNFSSLCCHVENSDLEPTLNHLEKVTKTILLSSYNDSDSGFLAKLLIDFLRHNTTNTDSILEVMESATNHFDLYVAEGVGKHFSSSQIIPGILIPFHQQIPKVDFIPEKNVSFVMLWNFLEIDLKENCKQTTFKISKNLDFATFYSFKNSLCKHFVNDCNSSGIQVILCCNEIPQFAKTLFEQHQILAMPYVSEETCEYFGNLFQKHPLNNISDQITDTNICAASFCKKAFISDSVYLQLGINQHEGICISSTLLLSAPTPALYHYLSRQIKKCLKSLKMCFKNSLWRIPDINHKGSDDKRSYQELPSAENISITSPRKILTIPVNVFQFRLWHFFEDISFKEFCSSNTNAQLLGEILTSAFRQVFLKCSSETNRNILEFLQKNNFQIASDDCQKDSFPKELCLPLLTELHILQSALHLVQQLLRIEGIVQLKGNKNLNKIEK